MNDRAPRPVVFVELCAGSAALSAAAQKQGFQVFPIDFHRNRFSPTCRILEIDMTHPQSAGLLNSMVDEMEPVAVHMGQYQGTKQPKEPQNLCLFEAMRRCWEWI